MCDIQSLAQTLKSRAATLTDGQQHWLGIAGAPGSGKSTVCASLSKELGDWAVVIPMDGYHLLRWELDRLEDPATAHARRGAPFTIHAQEFVDDLSNARRLRCGSFPGFDHGVGDPVEDSIVLSTAHRIVIVEGNYLLLDEPPWCRLRQTVFDEAWFLDVPVDECKQRVYRRHIATGKSKTDAQWRVDNNDSLNAELVNEASPKNANRVIRLK